MTHKEFKRTIRNYFNDSLNYANVVIFLFLAIVVGLSPFAGGQPLSLTIFCFALAGGFLFLSFYTLHFMLRQHLIETFDTGKGTSEIKESIKAVITHYDPIETSEEDNFFSFYFQVRERKWVDFFWLRNNFMQVYILVIDSSISINVLPQSGNPRRQPVGDLKVANKFRMEIIEKIKGC